MQETKCLENSENILTLIFSQTCFETLIFEIARVNCLPKSNIWLHAPYLMEPCRLKSWTLPSVNIQGFGPSFAQKSKCFLHKTYLCNWSKLSGCQKRIKLSFIKHWLDLNLRFRIYFNQHRHEHVNNTYFRRNDSGCKSQTLPFTHGNLQDITQHESLYFEDIRSAMMPIISVFCLYLPCITCISTD